MSETAESASTQIERGSDASLRQRLSLAHERIRELDDDNPRLRDQIAHLHGELRAARISTHVTDTVHDANGLLHAAKRANSPKITIVCSSSRFFLRSSRSSRLTADDYRTEMTRRFAVWNEVTGLTAAA